MWEQEKKGKKTKKSLQCFRVEILALLFVGLGLIREGFLDWPFFD